MTPQEFYDAVLEPNVAAALVSPSDRRLTINAIMTCDAFFGIYATAIGRDDSPYKADLARENHAWFLVRDTAWSLKHGKLDDPKPRLVRSPDAIITDELRWDDEGTWNDEEKWPDKIEQYILIEHESTRVRADLALKHSLHLAEALLKGEARKPVTRKDIKSGSVMS